MVGGSPETKYLFHVGISGSFFKIMVPRDPLLSLLLSLQLMQKKRKKAVQMVLALPLWVHSTEVFYRTYQRGLIPLGQPDLGRTRQSQSAGGNREVTFLFETDTYLSSNHRLIETTK